MTDSNPITDFFGFGDESGGYGISYYVSEFLGPKPYCTLYLYIQQRLNVDSKNVRILKSFQGSDPDNLDLQLPIIQFELGNDAKIVIEGRPAPTCNDSAMKCFTVSIVNSELIDKKMLGRVCDAYATVFEDGLPDLGSYNDNSTTFTTTVHGVNNLLRLVGYFNEVNQAAMDGARKNIMKRHKKASNWANNIR